MQGAIQDGDKITLTIKEYQVECAQLKSVVTTMEKNIKSQLKQFEGHRKTISADPSLSTERELFVHFFTDVDKLHSIVGEIGKRIDIIASSNRSS